jgi:hypothetical protein
MVDAIFIPEVPGCSRAGSGLPQVDNWLSNLFYKPGLCKQLKFLTLSKGIIA